MRATGVPTGTVCPLWTRTSSSTPSYGLGISESTLSVDTSKSGSSKETVSPTCLNQVPTVPSVTVSPSFGIATSCTSPSGGAPAGGGVTAASAWGAVAATGDPGGPMRTTGAPTGTVSPDWTRISTTTPSYGLGISESTLSVDTSKSGSSKETVSPTCLNQVPTVPSVTVSPSFGIATSCTSPSGGAPAGGGVTAASAWGAVAATGDPAGPMRTTGAPTGTVSPDWTRISTTTPSYGLGISESTLSVDTSKSGSSKETVSPTCLNQLPTVPSVTVSPSFGMVTVSTSLVVIRRTSAAFQPCRDRPEKVIMVSPNASDRLGCGWMNAPTSAGSASQFTAR